VIRAELGNLTVPELGKELGRRWGLLDAAAKLPFEQAAVAAKEKYQLAMSAYTPPTQPAAAATAAGKKMSKKAGLWIRTRIGSGFSDFVNPDPYWESGSGSRGKIMKKFQWKNALLS
jgi:hypothetical protein